MRSIGHLSIEFINDTMLSLSVLPVILLCAWLYNWARDRKEPKQPEPELTKREKESHQAH